jgi:hypothetical protein
MRCAPPSGASLPAALREAYLLFGRRPDLTAVQDRLLSPRDLALDATGTIVVFRTENQNCAAWGIAVADLGSTDPPVYVQHHGGWRPFLDRVSIACVEMVLSEVLLGRRHLGDTGWAAGNNVELVFLPTYSSWLKWIEPEFAALRYFALGGTDHRTHAWQGEMIDRYIRWRNAHAQPQTNFARTQSSAPGPVTRPTLHEAALVNNRVSGLTEAIQLSVPR